MVPDFETDYIVDSLESIFTCNYQELPAEVSLHKFASWSKNDMGRYTACLKEQEIDYTTLNNCRMTHISKICPKWFGMTYQNGTKCHRLLEQSDCKCNIKKLKSTDPQQLAMDEYVMCRNDAHSKARRCIDRLENFCNKKEVQAVKTVRARMSHAELLLKRIPNLKVVHLYRKPASVMPSRRGIHVLSMYGANDLVKEAELYCKLLVEDILIERRLEQQYPGQVTSYVYENYTKDAFGTIREVLEFVGLDMVESVIKSMDSDYFKRRAKLNKPNNPLTDPKFKARQKQVRDSQKVAPKKVYEDQSKEINSACRNLFQLVGDIWPDEQFADG